MIVYKGYYYSMTPAAHAKFDEYVDVVFQGHREYPCGTKVPIRYHDSVNEWDRIFREEVEVNGVKIDLFTLQDIYGTKYEAFIQQVAPDPRDNGALLVFLGFKAANGVEPPEMQWTDEEIALALC